MTVIDERTVRSRPAPNCDVLTHGRRRRRLRAGPRGDLQRSPWPTDEHDLLTSAAMNPSRRCRCRSRRANARGDDTVEPTRRSPRRDRGRRGGRRRVAAGADAELTLPAPARPDAAVHARRAAQRRRDRRRRRASCSCAAAHGHDPVNCLWVVDAATGEERLVADPAALLADDARPTCRPRSWPAASAPARPPAGSPATPSTATARSPRFALAGRLFVCDVESGEARELPVAGPVFDPRPDPAGQRVAYVSGRLLCVAELDGSWRVARRRRRRAGDGHVGQRRLHRRRGDATATAATGGAPTASTLAVDPRRHRAGRRAWHSPIRPSRPTPPRRVAYPPPAPPTPTCRCTSSASTASIVDVEWDRAGFPYLAEVQWSAAGLIIVDRSRVAAGASRSSTSTPTPGRPTVRFADSDDAWVELVAGTPRLWTRRRSSSTCADRDGARRLLVDGEPVTPADLQVRSVVAADGGGIVFIANPIDDATVLHVWRYDADGPRRARPTSRACTPPPPAAARSSSARPRSPSRGASWDTLDGVELTSVAGDAEPARSTPRSHFLGDAPPGHGRAAARATTTARRCRCCSTRTAAPTPCASCGRTTPTSSRSGSPTRASPSSSPTAGARPGRGTDWERAVHRDLATRRARRPDRRPRAGRRRARLPRPRPGRHPRLELRRLPRRAGRAAPARRLPRRRRRRAGDRVAAVRHPLHRALPRRPRRRSPTSTTASSLLPLAGGLTRPLLLIHGLADDNVVAAHTLQLSSALLAAGRPHEVLPLVGVTHMTPQEVVAENLLLHQLDFLRRSLGLAAA